MSSKNFVDIDSYIETATIDITDNSKNRKDVYRNRFGDLQIHLQIIVRIIARYQILIITIHIE